MNIYLDINDFVWKIDEHSKNYIGELVVNNHPKFGHGFTPAEVTLVIENKSTETVGYFPWRASNDVGLSRDHAFLCHTLLIKNIIHPAPKTHKIVAILHHQ